MKRILCLCMLILSLCGCSVNKDLTEDEILFELDWQGKHVLFYESLTLSYTDGSQNYSTDYQMLNSENGQYRLYVALMNEGNPYTVYQDGTAAEPIASFIYKDFSGEEYEKTLAWMKEMNLVSDDLELNNVTAVIYALDISKVSSIDYDGLPEYISRRWVDAGDNQMRGDSVVFTLEELTQIIGSWEKTSAAKNQIVKSSRTIRVSWEGVSDNYFVYNNGMNLHIPEINVSSVMINGVKLMEVENKLDYGNAFTVYYKLTSSQWDEFDEWVTNLELYK